MTSFKHLLAGISLLALAACETPVVQTAAPEAASASATSRSFLYAHALYGEPVFDRDVLSFQRALSTAFGTPAQTKRFGFTDRRLERPTPDAVDAAISSFASEAIDGRDTIIVMFTTHGGPDVLAVKPPEAAAPAGLPAEALANFLAPLNDDLQIIVLQACFSGSLIDDLASPNRIILTAAAADRTSFGCAPDNDNTFFIKSLNAALAEGGSWSEIFDRTKANVRALEDSFDIPEAEQSNPQSYVGRNMRGIWNGAGQSI